MDYTALTTAVDYTALIAGLGGVAAVLAGLFVAIRGGRTFLSFIKR
ncbi:MAG: hypothetical protein KZQ77_15435 [Candidatus Thiodiazotropha sp. (ex Notomyrtea botanica)]|nr:hypothetical protein [Candidatus Thiodiazotropha sp. (ex Notomyrtea botanica)]